MRTQSIPARWALLAAFLAAAGASAQDLPTEYQTGWHIVRSGENLIRITRAYLGDRELWRENWRLNPEIENPDNLIPGQRIQVLIAPDKTVPTARVKTLSGKVDEKPSPLPWNEAREEDLLIEKDGLRTSRNSSTSLSFVDGTELQLTEDSLVFLSRSGRKLGGESQRQVEIVLGQAEVSARGTKSSTVDLEILVGEARTVPQLDDEGVAQTRARKSAEGGAEVMVYEGGGEVEAAGQKVELPRGTGSAVPKGAAPGPPEPLLPAPKTLGPEAATEWNFPDPKFTWNAVAGASSYTLEICGDRACEALVQRTLGLTAVDWRVEPLPVSGLFWRVTAVAPSGLDGYPSATVPFTVLSDRLDSTPPVGRLTLDGPTSTVGGKLYHGAAARVAARVSDEQSGIDAWAASVGGREATEAELAGPWTSGDHRIEAWALDRRGNRVELPPLSFTVDADPPTLDARPQWVRSMLRRVRPAMANRRWLREKRRWASWALEEFAAAPEGPVWRVIAWGDAEHPVTDGEPLEPFPRTREAAVRSFEITGNDPEIMVLAPGLEMDDGQVLDRGRYLWLRAADEECGVVRRLTLKTVARDGGHALEVEAEDALGNVARVEWPFAGG